MFQLAQVERERGRGQVELARDIASGDRVGALLHEHPEDIEPGFLRERAERGDHFFTSHISRSIEISMQQSSAEKPAKRSLDDDESVGYDRAMAIKRVCVYCASSRQCDPAYHDAAARLGRELARNQVTLVYGGGSVGSMGHLADAALAEGGRVVGVLPRFMYDLKWGHRGLSELLIVNDLHERKRLMIEEVDAVIALPGGCGTLEELFEAITWKRLGLFTGAIVLVNTLGFYSKCVEFLESCIERHFMDERHRAMWSLVEQPEDVLAAIANAPPWPRENRDFAAL